MQIQGIQNNNYNTQFNGKVTVYGKNAKCKANKYIPESADKVLYDSFVRLLGEEAKKFCSSCGTHGLNKRDMREFVGFINILFGQHRPAITYFDENPKSKLFGYFYTTDGNGNLRYQICVNENDIVEHELHREGY